MCDEWLDFIAACRRDIPHSYDVIEGPMADDTIWDYVEDFINGNISREAFWALAKFKYPTHQIALCTEKALACLTFKGGNLLPDFNTTKFVCYIIEYISRRQRIHNIDTASAIGSAGLDHLFEFDEVLHCENKDEVADRLIEQYSIPTGDFVVEPNAEGVPTALQMGKVYARLFNNIFPDGTGADVITMYSSPICERLDDYGCGAFYLPSGLHSDSYEAGYIVDY